MENGATTADMDRSKVLALDEDDDSSDGKEELHQSRTDYGHDDASDAKDEIRQIFLRASHQMTHLSVGPADHGLSTENQPNEPNPMNLQIPMPLLSDGLVTFAYKRALLNRIKEHKLREGGRYDPSRYTPIFLHDMLMLPGSLASLIGKNSPSDILPRLTPALLPRHHTHIHPATLRPCLLPSSDPQAYIQGFVLFGQGKRARDIIHAHYRRQSSKSKRRKVIVEIEVVVLKPLSQRQHARDLYGLERRCIEAHAWKSKGKVEGCDEQCRNWKLEDFMEGKYRDEVPMRIKETGKGDEDGEGWIGRDVGEFDVEIARREVVYATGPGVLDYERIQGDGWSGW